MYLPPLIFIKSALQNIKKIVIVCAVLYIVISLFFYFWSKSDTKLPDDPNNQLRAQLYQTINDKNLKKTDDGRTYVALYQIFTCTMVGEGCTANPQDSAKYVNQSIMGRLNSFLVFPYAHPPASGVISTYATLQKAGFIPHSYAAEGIGLAALTPFKPIWLIFRNLILLMMVIIIVIIGFMIMFRAKINPQTVISIENALPKIAIALLLITFSYAIAGFLIDIMYVVMGLIAGLFNNQPLGYDANRVLSQAYYDTDAGLIGAIFSDNHITTLASSFYDLIPGTLAFILNNITTTFFLRFALLLVGSKIPLFKSVDGQPLQGGIVAAVKNVLLKLKVFQNILTPTASTGTQVIALIAGLLLFAVTQVILFSIAKTLVILIMSFILLLSLAFIYFRLFFMFISVYVQILLLIMFSPIILALEAIPGRNTFADWIKSLLVHLSTFPLFLLLVLISKAIIQMRSPEALWRPPYTYGFPGDAFQVIIAMALIYMAPEFIKMFKEMTGVKPMAASLNLGSFVSGATVAVGGALGLATQFHSIKSTLVGVEYGKGLFGSNGTFRNPFTRPHGRAVTPDKELTQAEELERSQGR